MRLKITLAVMISILICLPAISLEAATENIKKDFKDSEAFPFYEKGNEHLKSGLCELAIGEYNKGVELAPDSYELYNKLGYASYYCGRFDEALNYFRKSLILNRDNVDTIVGIANVYMVLKQEPEARHYFEKVVEMEPGNSAPYMPLALIYNHRNMFAESKEMLKTVLKNYPRYDSAYFLLAQDHEELKEIDSAIESYKKVTTLTPGYAKAYLGLARCYKLKAKYGIAYNYAKRAKKLRPSMEEVDDIINSLKRSLRYDKASRANRKAREEKSASENIK